ncbi:MAG TPA: manganese ABC transporter ATP-binding protein, partial [Pseudomonas sp.]|nr:manganese ABC transporter ATP-binding protein [Pseudomonas sp.]
MTAAAHLTAPAGPRIEFAGIDLTLGRTRILDQVQLSVAAR